MGAQPSADQKTSSPDTQTTTETLATFVSGQDLDQQVAKTPTLFSAPEPNQQAVDRRPEWEDTTTNACITALESHQQLPYGAACTSSGLSYLLTEAFGVSAADSRESFESNQQAVDRRPEREETKTNAVTTCIPAPESGEAFFHLTEAFGVSAADNRERVEAETSISHRLRGLSIQSTADGASCSAAAPPIQSRRLPFQDASPEKTKTANFIITAELGNAAGAHASVKIGSPACKQPSPSPHGAALVQKPAVPQAPASLPLATQVIKWTIQDITNDNLLLDEVKSIPEAFSNLQEYLDYFKWPLLEEVRAQLKQVLADHTMEVTPYACVHRTRQQKHKGSKISRDDIESRIDVLVDRELKRQTSGTKDSAKFQLFAMDLVLLCTVLPHSVQDLHRIGTLHTFAFVIKVPETPISNTQMWTTMVVQASRGSTQYQELLNGKRTWYALFVENLTPSLRIWEALHPSKSLAKSGFPIVLETLYGSVNPPGVTNSLKPAITRNHVVVSKAVRDYCDKFHILNNSQTNAIVDIVSDIETKRPPIVRMIQGPPGTGKTSTIVVLVALTSCLNLKCLVTAPTNAAISELAIRFMNFRGKISNQMIEHLHPFRKSFTRELASIEVRDVVLLGNQEKLRLHGELEEIFLPERIKRLMIAQKGWKEAARSILKILISGKSQYDQYCKLDLDLHSTTSHGNYPSFLDYVKNTLSKLVTKAELHGECLIRELPTSIIGKTGRERLSEIVNLAVTLRDLVTSLGASQLATITRDRLFATTTPLRCHLTEAAEAKVHSQSSLEAACMKDSRIVFCTVCTAGRECMRRSAAPFDLLIIDEASQLVEAETAIVSQMPGISNAVLVGDHKQLRATVISQGAARCGYGRSLFERLQKVDHPSHLLSVQYRMHPAISSFPNSQFYNGRIADGENVKSAKYNKKIYQNQLYGPFAVIDVGQGLEEDDSGTNKSKKNPVEAAVISFLIRKLSKVIATNNFDNVVSVGVITSYASQVGLLEKQLESVKMSPRLIVEVASVDAFQGQEKDIILLSTVRANKDGNIGFLKDERRMNVALTRARYSLWIVGNCQTLSKGDNNWKKLVKDARKRNLYINVANDPKFPKEIRNRKRRVRHAHAT